jgi:hypothetical protein
MRRKKIRKLNVYICIYTYANIKIRFMHPIMSFFFHIIIFIYIYICFNLYITVIINCLYDALKLLNFVVILNCN